MITPKPWQDELNRAYTARLEFMRLYDKQRARIPWHRRMANRARYSISEARERLGELVAGRRFDE